MILVYHENLKNNLKTFDTFDSMSDFYEQFLTNKTEASYSFFENPDSNMGYSVKLSSSNGIGPYPFLKKVDIKECLMECALETSKALDGHLDCSGGIQKNVYEWRAHLNEFGGDFTVHSQNSIMEFYNNHFREGIGDPVKTYPLQSFIPVPTKGEFAYKVTNPYFHQRMIFDSTGSLWILTGKNVGSDTIAYTPEATFQLSKMGTPIWDNIFKVCEKTGVDFSAVKRDYVDFHPTAYRGYAVAVSKEPVDMLER
ncbi:MAG: hypothetical protein LUD48_00290 [Prevotella sp.]|nr:hypothetical protein [Prevotella sp.]